MKPVVALLTVANVLISRVSAAPAAGKDYNALYKWRADYLTADVEFVSSCVASVDRLSTQATLDDGWALNGDCAGVYTLFDRPTSSVSSIHGFTGFTAPHR